MGKILEGVNSTHLKLFAVVGAATATFVMIHVWKMRQVEEAKNKLINAQKEAHEKVMQDKEEAQEKLINAQKEAHEKVMQDKEEAQEKLINDKEEARKKVMNAKEEARKKVMNAKEEANKKLLNNNEAFIERNYAVVHELYNKCKDFSDQIGGIYESNGRHNEHYDNILAQNFQEFQDTIHNSLEAYIDDYNNFVKLHRNDTDLSDNKKLTLYETQLEAQLYKAMCMIHNLQDQLLTQGRELKNSINSMGGKIASYNVKSQALGLINAQHMIDIDNIILQNGLNITIKNSPIIGDPSCASKSSVEM